MRLIGMLDSPGVRRAAIALPPPGLHFKVAPPVCGDGPQRLVGVA